LTQAGNRRLVFGPLGAQELPRPKLRLGRLGPHPRPDRHRRRRFTALPKSVGVRPYLPRRSLRCTERLRHWTKVQGSCFRQDVGGKGNSRVVFAVLAGPGMVTHQSACPVAVSTSSRGLRFEARLPPFPSRLRATRLVIKCVKCLRDSAFVVFAASCSERLGSTPSRPHAVTSILTRPR
jgi:hypothetical protein